MKPLLPLSLVALAGCPTVSPLVAVVETQGAFSARSDGRWLLAQVEGGAVVGAHYKAQGDPFWLAPPVMLDQGGWWIVDLTDAYAAQQLPDPPTPWPAWVGALGLMPAAVVAEHGIVFEDPAGL